MSEKTEITFMQTRLIRLASEEWHLPVEQIIHLFRSRCSWIYRKMLWDFSL